MYFNIIFAYKIFGKKSVLSQVSVGQKYSQYMTRLLCRVGSTHQLIGKSEKKNSTHLM